MQELISKTHFSWHNTLNVAFKSMDSEYLEFLKSGNFIPSQENFLNAFKTLPKNKVKYILFGQDPYPREESAIGYAFIDGKVKSIFSQNGLSKEVNRATSLRNFIKMALVAMGRLRLDNTSKEAVSKAKKNDLINSIYELKDNFEKNGVLLLNSALIFTDKKSSNYHIKHWQPFIKILLGEMGEDVELILFGNHAKEIKKRLNPKQKSIEIEHPYNVSFISSDIAQNLFGKMNLLFRHNF